MKRLAIAILGFSMISASVYALADQVTNEAAQNPAPAGASSATNQAESDAFLAANKKKPGVVTLTDGLQYKILTKGKGPKPQREDVVTVHYAGKLINGTEFDSSYKHGGPASFPVNGVIPGWVEALQLMNVGSTWELYVPPALAYGEQGAPPSIGPNQALIFTVKLIDIKKS